MTSAAAAEGRPAAHPAARPAGGPAEVRAATADDVDTIAAVALATGQDDEWSGSDPAYTRYLMDTGQVVVAVRDGRVIGFGATRRIGAGPAAPVMLCDLFVDPRAHGGGAGRAMLDELFAGTGPRLTFSSVHAMALPLYTSFGLDAWWPLLYLRGDVRALAAPDGWTAEPVTAAQAAALERDWTGTDRAADYRAWAGRPGGQAMVASRAGQPAAAGIVAGAGDGFGLIHLALAPGARQRAARGPAAGDTAAGDTAAGDTAAGDAIARDAVLAALAWLGGRGVAAARAWLPAPHPAVRPLLRAGWRSEEFDLFMATDPDLLDPRRAVPSPGLP